VLIDRECEDFLALHSPVATDLRLVIAILKMSGSLERIGDHAYGISVFVYDEKLKLNKEIIHLVKLDELFDDIDDMLDILITSFQNGDVSNAKRIFKKDKIIDKVNKQLPQLLQDYLKNTKDKISNMIRRPDQKYGRGNYFLPGIGCDQA
jgi:phosphate transport system protein